MKVMVNGEAEEVPEGTTLRALVTMHKLSVDKVAVEKNRRLARAPQYDVPLAENDQIEIVTFVGGG